MKYHELNIHQKINVKQSIINWYENIVKWSLTAKKYHRPAFMNCDDIEVDESECEMIQYTKNTNKRKIQLKKNNKKR